MKISVKTKIAIQQISLSKWGVAICFQESHIVISKKSKSYFPAEVTVVNNFEDAIKATNEDENPFIIGGGQIYNIAMKYCDIIELTRVHEEFEADTFFPKIKKDEWQLISEEKHEMDERHEYSFTYKTYLKIK